ncbi:MAG TPA: histidine kinase, partial [Actinomycetota bacterium]|nr:histidine kinase [Actinomycetota bacterium]
MHLETDQGRATGGAPAWFLPGISSVAVILVVASMAGRMLDGDPEGLGFYSPHPLAGLTFLLVGAAIVPRQPRNAVGWLFVAVGLSAGGVAVAASFAAQPAMLWLNQWLPALSFGLIPLALLVFPDGQLPGPRWRPALWFGMAGVAATVLALAWAAWLLPGVLFARPDHLRGAVGTAFSISRLGAMSVLITTLLAVASLVARRRKAGGDTRHQINVLAMGAVAVPVGIVLEVVNLPGSDLLLASAVPVAAGAAILKYRLFDIDLFLNRSLVYATLTALLTLIYAALATVLGALFDDGRVSPLVATGVVAVAFQPLRARVERAVSRLLYGERDDPYSAVSRIARILEPATEPDALLPRLAGAVTESLGVPYAGIEMVDTEGAGRLVASRGRRVIPPEEFAMVHNGRLVGRLLVSPRTVGGSFTARERALLEDLARQSGVAVDAMQLTDELRASRARLVRSREDERRRLRNELHDGVGPALAGATMQVGAARGVPAEETDAALDRLQEILQMCLTEIRQIVEDLRPASLDALGLEGAIRQRAAIFGNSAAGSSGISLSDSTVMAGPSPEFP